VDPCPDDDPGCRTTTHETPSLAPWTLTKSSDPASGGTVQPGDTITYTVHARRGSGDIDPSGLVITDDLSKVLNNASFVAGSMEASLGTASRDGSTITWHIPALSKNATLTYTVRVDKDAWDVRLRNVATVPDGDPQPQPCAADKPECRTTNHHTPPHNQTATWTVTKSSNPASGSTVSPGDVVTYTLTARVLTGSRVAQVRLTDDLSDVLDDATWVSGSVTTSAGKAVRSGDRLTWRIDALTGRQTLSYQVRVKAGAAGGRLYNVVAAPGAAPCEPARAAVSRASVRTGRAVAARVLTCRETEQTVAAAAPSPGGNGGNAGGGGLPDTGGPSGWWIGGGLGSVLVGGMLVAAARRRRWG